MKKSFIVLSVVVMLLSGCESKEDFTSVLNERLPELGHRNWIIIADSAYPKQSAPGIETIYTDAEQIEVLQKVLSTIDDADHIQPVIMLDAELKYVTEDSAAGVEAYRAKLKQLFDDRPVKEMPHEDIITKLDKASELFNVLLLKTDLTIPYTSVFIELDCGYWDAEKENALRAAFSAAK